MVWECLSDKVESICEEWRQRLFSSADWSPTSDQPSSGEANGIKVASDSVPFGAYLKPGREKNDNISRAANEKICADLAQDVDVPVPPALLCDQDSVIDDQPECTVLSLYLSDQAWSLRDLQDISDPPWDLLEDALEEASTVVAFDAWVGNTDTDTGNTVFIEDQEGNYRAVHIDLAYALNKKGRWEDGNGGQVTPPNYHDRVADNFDEEEILEGANRIESYSDINIEQIVERIPDSYMQPDEREVVASALIERRSRVRSAVSSLA